MTNSCQIRLTTVTIAVNAEVDDGEEEEDHNNVRTCNSTVNNSDTNSNHKLRC